nr:hypothetical protein [uncultured Pseudogulbenkiania sp.]
MKHLEARDLLNAYLTNYKHANYQLLPRFVASEFDVELPLDIAWRGDYGRLDYLQSHYDFSRRRVMDIGANAGLFALSIARDTPSANVIALEKHPDFCAFMGLVRNGWQLENLTILSQAYSLPELQALPMVDDLLFFNVIHHAGVEFDQASCPFKSTLATYWAEFLGKVQASRIFFQMGYNWGGDKSEPIFEGQSLSGMVDLVCAGAMQSGWRVSAIVIVTDYEQRMLAEVALSDIAHWDDIYRAWMAEHRLSEFYRRPLFVLEKK